VLQALNGEQLQLFVRLRLGRHRLTGALTDLNLEGARVGEPSARREGFEELGDGGERFRLTIELVERIGTPIQRGVGSRRLRRHQRREPLDRPRPLRALDRLLPLFIEIVPALAFILGAFALAFRPLARPIRTVAFLVARGVGIVLDRHGCAQSRNKRLLSRISRRGRDESDARDRDDCPGALCDCPDVH
jgi:hypothetical protein